MRTFPSPACKLRRKLADCVPTTASITTVAGIGGELRCGRITVLFTRARRPCVSVPAMGPQPTCMCAYLPQPSKQTRNRCSRPVSTQSQQRGVANGSAFHLLHAAVDHESSPKLSLLNAKKPVRHPRNRARTSAHLAARVQQSICSHESSQRPLGATPLCASHVSGTHRNPGTALAKSRRPDQNGECTVARVHSSSTHHPPPILYETSRRVFQDTRPARGSARPVGRVGFTFKHAWERENGLSW